VITPDRAVDSADSSTDGAGSTSPAERHGPDLRYAALGAVGVVQERLARLARGATGATYAVVHPIVTTAVPLIPAPVRRVGVGAVRRLDEHGRAVATATTNEASRAAEAFADRLGEEPAVMRMVDRVVDQVQWRVVDVILPVVLERLAAEPEQVRTIVLGQSRGMAEELTQAARARAVAGDQAVDRFFDRLLRRRSVAGAPGDGRTPVDVLPADGLPSE
jgi:hypothetical protein